MKRHVIGPILFVLVAVVACTNSASLGIPSSETDSGVPPSFSSPPDEDGGTTAAAGELTSYCPSSQCPTGWTACPNSRFPCDVDLKTDRNNCGACGVACPAETGSEVYECVEGRCVLACIDPYFDCDGAPDNGCEVRAATNDQCGACETKCEDPARPCTRVKSFYQCGCAGDQLYCASACRDAKSDDRHCGACGNACDPTGGGGPAYANTYYGCVDSECGQLKCRPAKGNCDGDILNGCETDLLTSENCGSCGRSCGPGEECRIDAMTQLAQCMCPAGKTFCPAYCNGDVCAGGCFDLSADRRSCGACDVQCPEGPNRKSLGACTFGMCTLQCLRGWADCNGYEGDDCEVNTDSDPQNCGACGRVCDAVAGQACVGGQCVVEPCDQGQDAGEFAR